MHPDEDQANNFTIKSIFNADVFSHICLALQDSEKDTDSAEQQSPEPLDPRQMRRPGRGLIGTRGGRKGAGGQDLAHGHVDHSDLMMIFWCSKRITVTRCSSTHQ